MVVEVKLNKYIKVTLISAKRFKSKIFTLFAESSIKTGLINWEEK